MVEEHSIGEGGFTVIGPLLLQSHTFTFIAQAVNLGLDAQIYTVYHCMVLIFLYVSDLCVSISIWPYLRD